ncbi:MAG: hypothetical protein GTO02_21245, partial [Candidatus Dadabacteria bacterium]|nr:hypothetical protein [Candidatus Dadabacteria bacterium]
MTEYKYKEIINKYALMYVLNHADKYELGKDALYIGGSLTRDKDSILTLYNKYLNRLVLDDIDTGKSYIENRYKRRGDCARLWSVETSLTNISRRLRHTIAREYNIDIDIKNCHPVFLQYFAKNNGLDTPCLDFYIENRDEVIQNILTYFPDKEKDDIKKQLLSVINRGDVYLKHDFIYAFSNECKDIESKICEIKPKLYEKIKKQKDFNPEGSVINLMLCEMEDNALNVMIKIIECEGLKITSLAYDGLTIERTDCDLSSVLGKCEDAIYEQLGVRVRVVEKEMNQYLDLPEDYKKQLFGKCKCLLEHHKYHTIINLFKDIFNVHIYCVDFLKIISFLYNTMSPGCYIRLSSSIISGLDRFNESHLDSVYNISGLDHTLDWKWVLRFIPKSKQYLLL